MKLAYRDIEPFVKSPNPAARVILIYGPDSGLMKERAKAIGQSIVVDINDPFNAVTLSTDLLNEDPARFSDEANAMSMMGGGRLIRVEDASDKLTPLIKEYLENPNDSALIVLEAGELGPRSSLRKLCESAKNAAALPCYVEDERDISRVLKDALKEEGYNMPSDALVYMAANVVGDRAVARSEVQKLVTYMGANRNITLDDVIACVGNSAALSLDDLSKHVASGQFPEAERILSFVLSEGLPAVTVLRTLQNYFTRLFITKARMDKGENMDAAMKKLRPEVFWKLKPAFEAQLRGWSMENLQMALNQLVSTEAKCKQTGSDPEILCGRAILAITQMAARGMRRRA